MAVIEKIDIKDFQQYSSAEDADCMLMVKKDGTGGRMTLVLLRGQIGSDVKPTIREGIWWIGNLNTNIPAEGLTPEFRSNALGIEWKYVKEPAASWRMLAGYETLKLKFSDLTVAQKRELIPHLKDFTPEEIAELQKPATDAITRVTATETEVKRVEALRVTAESARVAEENKRASAENTRATEEGKRVSAESARKTEYSQIITDTNKAKNDAIAETAKTVKAISDTNTAIAGAKRGEDNANAAALKVDTSTATLNATETEVKRVEALRVTEENKRVTEENKRTVAESARVTEETKRATSENTRATEEGKRVSAESARVVVTNTCKEVIKRADASAVNANAAALEAYNLISEVKGADIYARLPATMVVDYISDAVLGSSPIIRAKIFPESANKSIVFQPGSVGCFVAPDGTVQSPASAGDIVVYAISTQQSNVWKEIKIRFRNQVARTTEGGAARTTETGVAIEC